MRVELAPSMVRPRPISLHTIRCILGTRARLRRACDVASQTEFSLGEAHKRLRRVQPDGGKKRMSRPASRAVRLAHHAPYTDTVFHIGPAPTQ